MVALYLQQRISFGACLESFSYNKDDLLLGNGLMLVELRWHLEQDCEQEADDGIFLQACGSAKCGSAKSGLIKNQDHTSRMAYAAEASCGLMVLTGQLIGVV
ncbi:hypothetical protein O0I10_007431 [Lichtheimia ornata]|uniref:Uncharacterized protein n=1 Tax=Lichtheimia ornata TaxID=688661 RepID=A0AAD7V163_9FUNG|nr:uncharacterized protein O0I10_007431 [Lichtheimia ornata]KAJ8656834.1 hypothetical protein O0I10_007431 [Lichtheimia ornata]